MARYRRSSRRAKPLRHARRPCLSPDGQWAADRNGKNKHASLTHDEAWDAATTTLGRFDALGRAVAYDIAYDDIADLGYRVAVTE